MNKYGQSKTNSKCLWCGKALQDNFREVAFKEAYKSATPQQILVCSEDCEKTLIETEKSFEGKLPLFIAGFVTAMLLSIAGAILSTSNPNFIYLIALSIFVLGLTITFLPFVTPQTVGLMGFEKAYRLVRVLGVGLMVAGIALAIGFGFIHN